MSKREDYKRFIVFCLASLVVLAQAAVFAWVWYSVYRGQIDEPFWRKGNWVLIAIYGLMFALFAKLYGGLKVGYLKRIDVFYSLTLALLCTNVVEYLEITLINRWFLSVWPMIEMTGIQLVLIIIWIFGSRYIYSGLYRARRLLVIYGDRDPGDDLIHKMNSRKDKYDISGKVHISVGLGGEHSAGLQQRETGGADRCGVQRGAQSLVTFASIPKSSLARRIVHAVPPPLFSLWHS